MAKVVWTAGALADLSHIEAYIHEFNPYAAHRLAARIIHAGQSLGENPFRGRSAALERRELTVVPPYLIRYSVEDDAVYIREIRHGARRPD